MITNLRDSNNLKVANPGGGGNSLLDMACGLQESVA